MLDTARWEHAGALLSVYDYLLRRMALANATKNAATVREVQGIVGELGSAFRTAAQTSTPDEGAVAMTSVSVQA